jgi:hypothetical protein
MDEIYVILFISSVYEDGLTSAHINLYTNVGFLAPQEARADMASRQSGGVKLTWHINKILVDHDQLLD